ncbi:unnamed protein product [Allacma fusca]|uniref:CCHC-type domain-containing protein n=1 Tax=Allacma fusca TaxID=39272 RepID=A0A8J2LZK5_9HEXA|nr:unnamed protein product [Allacma fusca]
MDLSFQADLKYPHRNGNRPHDEFIWLQECMKQNNNKDFVHLSSEQADKVDNFKLDSLYDVMSVNEEAPVMYCNTKIMLRKMLGDIISQKEVAIVIQRWYRDTYRFGLICMVAVATQEMTYLVPVLKDYQLATRTISNRNHWASGFIGKLIRVKIPTSIQTIAEILSDCKYLKSQEPEMIKVLNSILPREFEETITQEMEIDSDEYNDLEITHEELEERTSAPSLVEETTPTPADVTLIDRTSQGVKITVTVPTSSRTVPLRPSAPFDSSRTCSSCGEVGHFRRNCQNDWVPNRFKLSRSQLSKKNKKRGGRKVQERKHQLLNQPQS